MRRDQRQAVAAGLLAVACYMPVLSSANMQAALDGMFTSVTNPSAYHSQNRMGAVGGALSLRTPNQRVNLMTLDMPRYDMGCGAIDMFGGSFSFINADKLIAIMRNIGQIAVAALFKIAIAAISEKLSLNISEFTKIMHDLNNMKMNSCKVGAAIAGKIADATGIGSAKNQSADNKADVLKAATGKDSEGWGQWWKKLSMSLDEKVPPADSNIGEAGNSTWRALWNSEAHKTVMMGDGKDGVVATLIMNIAGTEILPTAGDCSKEPKPDVCKQYQDRVAPNKLTVASLIDPDDSKIAIFEDSEKLPGELNEFSFVKVSSHQGSLSDLLKPDRGQRPGFRALAMRVLFGEAADTLEFSPISSGSVYLEPDGGIVHYINTGEWGTFNATAWLDRLSSPVLRNLVVVQRDKKALTATAMQFAGLIAEDMAVHFATALGDAAKNAFSGKAAGIVSKPDDFENSVDEFRRGVAKYKLSQSEQAAQLRTMQVHVESIAKTLGNPSLTVLPKGK